MTINSSPALGMPENPITFAGVDGGRLLHVTAHLVDQSLHLARVVSANERGAHLQHAHLDDDRRGRSAALLHLRLDDRSARGNGAAGPQFEHLRLEQNHFQQMVDPLTLYRGHGAHDGVSTPIFGGESLLLQLALHLVDVCAGKIDLRDRHDDLHPAAFCRRPRMAERFERLRHDAVRGIDHENNHIRNRRAAGAHRGECRVTRGIEERNRVLFSVSRLVLHRVRPDVLRDSASFARRNPRFANRIHQRRLAVIDVTHEDHDRSASLENIRLAAVDLLGLWHRWRLDFLLFLVNAGAFLPAFFLETSSRASRKPS
jgi:hypothetical protein